MMKKIINFLVLQSLGHLVHFYDKIEPQKCLPKIEFQIGDTECIGHLNKFVMTPSPTGCHYHIKSGVSGYCTLRFRNNAVSGYFENDSKYYEIFGNFSNAVSREVLPEPKRILGCDTVDQMVDQTENYVPKKPDLKRLRRSLNDVGNLFGEVIFIISKEIVDKWRGTGQTISDQLVPVYERFEEIFNVMADHYKEIGVQLILLDIHLWDDRNPIVVSGEDAGRILANFQRWRRNIQRDNPNNVDSQRWLRHDIAQLYIPEDTFSSGVIGKAYVGELCGAWAVGVVADHSSHVPDVAATGSHEMGHNFGLTHDQRSCECVRGSGCIMGSSMTSGNPPNKWSDCSVNIFDEELPKRHCLVDVPPPHLVFGSPQCGNHIVEDGEDCDCGDVDECPCCNPKTCKFLDESECFDGACCSNCQLRKIGSQCRVVSNDCDLSEYCNGVDEYCPRNDFKQNGQLCNNDNGMCLDGTCKLPDDQCKMLWGDDSRSSDTCMKKNNIIGRSYGFCKEDRGRYLPCNDNDAVCGKQHCIGGPKDPVAKGYSYAQGYEVPTDGEQCKVILSLFKKASFDDAEPHMVQNGVPCGTNQFCILGECRQVTDFFPECPMNCSDHGTCNNHDQCACDCGWGGDDCSTLQWCHEFYIVAVTSIIVSAVLVVVIVILIYALRTFYFGISFWPVCPLRPNPDGQFTAGQMNIGNPGSTEAYPPLPQISRAEIVSYNQDTSSFPAPPPSAEFTYSTPNQMQSQQPDGYIPKNIPPIPVQSKVKPQTNRNDYSTSSQPKPNGSPRPSRAPPPAPAPRKVPQPPIPPSKSAKPKPPLPPQKYL